MRSFFMVVPLSVCLGLTAACIETEIPKVEMPKMDEFDVLKALSTCSKKESEVTFSRAALENSYDVEDLVESKDIEFIDCDGKVSSRGHGPVRNVIKVLEVPAPTDLPDSVNFIEVSSPRSCAEVRIRGDEAQSGEYNPAELTEAQRILYGSHFRRKQGGAVTSIVVTDSTLKLLRNINVKDGANPLIIRFFGKCLVYRSDKQKDDGDHISCEKAKLLAKQEITVNLKVTRPRVGGVVKKSVCTEKD